MNQWENISLTFENINLAALHKGQGKKLLICFHGYQQSKELFVPVFEHLPQDWQVLAIDQPLHGQTTWENHQQTWGYPFFELFWQKIIAQFSFEKIFLLGFSMGGKSAMALTKVAPIPIEKLILIAPGGVQSHPLEVFFSYHSLGQQLFKLSLKHYRPFMSIMDFAYERKMLRKFQHRFIKAQFATHEARTRMRSYLRVYSHFNIQPEQLNNLSGNVQLYLIWGTKDSVTQFSRAKHFLSLFPQTQFFEIKAAKHNLLEENRAEMQRLLGTILGFEVHN